MTQKLRSDFLPQFLFIKNSLTKIKLANLFQWKMHVAKNIILTGDIYGRVTIIKNTIRTPRFCILGQRANHSGGMATLEAIMVFSKPRTDPEYGIACPCILCRSPSISCDGTLRNRNRERQRQRVHAYHQGHFSASLPAQRDAFDSSVLSSSCLC